MGCLTKQELMPSMTLVLEACVVIDKGIKYPECINIELQGA